ncbi:MAG: isoprenylcysteine carboxylmethyltransferase family protein [Pseudomonadota bacterium]
MSPQLAIFYLWDAWMVSWIAAALWADRPTGWPKIGSQALHWALTLAGFFLLLGVPAHEHAGPGRLWDVGEPPGWALFGLAALGLTFCWWARLHLGRLWSGSVSRKADHHIVDTGPYAIVRHPIYTGLIVAAFATGAMRGTIIALSGAALMTIGFRIKARLEERFLRRELGSETYDSYCRRVPMLAPFGPRRA